MSVGHPFPKARRKQVSEQAEWEALVRHLEQNMDETRARSDRLVDQAAERLSKLLPADGHVAYCWSGGKDSQALRAVAEAAGIHESVLVLCGNLEFPEFVAWCTDQMPDGLTIEKRPWDLDWLRDKPELIFPSNQLPNPGNSYASKWHKGVQHWGQRRYARRTGITHMLMGRRHHEGNYCGKDGVYVDREGFTRVSPIYDWKHVDVLSICVAMDLPLAPIYWWPRGFRVGTGPWPARQWCASVRAGWNEVWEIDPDVVRVAAEAFIPGAAEQITIIGNNHAPAPTGSCVACDDGAHIDCQGRGCKCNCLDARRHRRLAAGHA